MNFCVLEFPHSRKKYMPLVNPDGPAVSFFQKLDAFNKIYALAVRLIRDRGLGGEKLTVKNPLI